MPIVVILGMHRSGTSVLTRTLHEAGLDLGSGLLNDSRRDNLEGHWESIEVTRINERLLEISGGSWRRLPPVVRGDGETEGRMKAFIQSFDGRPLAGWKDPRTTATFPLWKPLLREYRLVAAVRHPESVARSLEVRDGFTRREALDLWAQYNERLLQIAHGNGDILWFDFDAEPNEVTSSLAGICGSLGLTFEARAQEAFNPYLRHHHELEPITDRRIGDLYARLRARMAEAQPRSAARPVRIDAAERAAIPEARVLKELRRLARVQILHNAQLQKTQVQAEKADWLSTRLEAVRSEVHQGTTAALEHVGSLDAHVHALDSHLHTIDTRVDSLIGRMDPLVGRAESLTTAVRELQADARSAADRALSSRAQLDVRIQNATSRLESLEWQLARLSAEITELRRPLLERLGTRLRPIARRGAAVVRSCLARVRLERRS